MEISSSLHRPATLPPGQESCCPLKQGAEWAPEPVWTSWRRGTSDPTGILTPDRPSRSLVTTRRIPKLFGNCDKLDVFIRGRHFSIIHTRSLSSDLWLADHPGAEEYRHVWDHQHRRYDADCQSSDGLHELLRQPNPLRVPVGSLPQSIPQSGQMWPHGTARTWGNAVPKSINHHHPSPSKRQVRRWQKHHADPH